METPLLAVVVLNWNQPTYTLNSIESLLRSDYSRLRIIVVDNDSTDDSWRVFQSWSTREFVPAAPANPHLAILLNTDRRHEPQCCFADDNSAPATCSADLIFLRRDHNGGYAAGNNTGLRRALMLGADFVWVLNNDTLVDPQAARLLVEHMQKRPQVGLCGTTIMQYDEPEKIQTLGGRHWNRWLAHQKPLLHQDRVRSELSFVEGASCCVSRQFLETVGMLCEEYFLYIEELDWAMRSAGRLKLDYCAEAIVYHKHMGSFENSSRNRKIAKYHGLRGALLVTRKFWPSILPVVYLSMLGRMVVQAVMGRFSDARVTFAATTQFLRSSKPPANWTPS